MENEHSRFHFKDVSSIEQSNTNLKIKHGSV